MTFDMIPEALWHAAKHAMLHSLPLLPFLYLTYLCMELLERRAGKKVEQAVARAGKAGPLWGALLGVIPQCGFSAAGAGLYAGRLISAGTLLSVFLSTSDEMLPIFLSQGVAFPRIVKILGIKVAVAIAVGFSVDLVSHLIRRGKGLPAEHAHIGEMCEAGHCACDHKPLPLAALIHTVQIFLTVLLVSFAINIPLELGGEAALSALLTGAPVLGCLLAALVGLIPNCAASVAVTTLYLEGVISAGALFSGLLVGAGVGLLVLFRVNRPLRDNWRLVAILYAAGAGFGVLFDVLKLGNIIGL